jgi:hypothetical protein
MILWTLWMAWAGPADALIAPTLDTVDVGVARVEGLLTFAREAEAKLSDATSAFALAGCPSFSCSLVDGASWVATAQRHGASLRNAAQSARMDIQRARAAADAPTVRPLLDAARDARLARGEAEVAELVQRYLTRLAWYERFMAPWAQRHARAVAAACAESP